MPNEHVSNEWAIRFLIRRMQTGNISESRKEGYQKIYCPVQPAVVGILALDALEVLPAAHHGAVAAVEATAGERVFAANAFKQSIG